MEKSGNNFGTLKGVFVPSILTILGVILFLRMGWLVGHAGLTQSIIIIGLSSLITFLTGLSISSTATNTAIGSGGSYYLISRCFGVEPGAAVGIPLYLAQALGISFYSVGFAESLGLFFPEIPITQVAFATLCALTLLTFISSDLALKMQVYILISVILALVSFYFGKPIDYMAAISKEPTEAIGSIGFWQLFAVFFPAVTGIEAGISMSGDLKNPRKSLPIGTMSAVVVGTIVYMFTAYMLTKLADPVQLVSNSLIMTEIAVFSIVIFVGLWGATLSSTMGALLGAPRTLQALAKDRILPKFLAKGSAKTNEPRIATVVSFLIASAGILLGDLNSIASILSMFFLTSYGALNLVAALEGLIENPSWRPIFNVSWVVSFLGAILCFGAMFMINPGSSFIAIGAVILIYFITKKRKIKTNYSDIRSGLVFHFTKKFIYGLGGLKKDARNWRPNFLIFSGSLKKRFHLIRLADAIGHKKSFMTVVKVITDDIISTDRLESFESANKDFLSKNNIKALTKIVKAPGLKTAVANFIDYYGIGAIKANTIVIGDAHTSGKYKEHADILSYAHKRGVNVLVVKDTSDSENIFNSKKKKNFKIDLWWAGKGDNKSLMLAYAYMLKSSEEWRKARLNIKSIADDEFGKEYLETSLSKYLIDSRIKANIEVFVHPGKDKADIIAAKSKDADVVFLGMKAPEEGVCYEEDYRRIINFSKELQTSVLVMASEDLNFQDIFL